MYIWGYMYVFYRIPGNSTTPNYFLVHQKSGPVFHGGAAFFVYSVIHPRIRAIW